MKACTWTKKKKNRYKERVGRKKERRRRRKKEEEHDTWTKKTKKKSKEKLERERWVEKRKKKKEEGEKRKTIVVTDFFFFFFFMLAEISIRPEWSKLVEMGQIFFEMELGGFSFWFTHWHEIFQSFRPERNGIYNFGLTSSFGAPSYYPRATLSSSSVYSLTYLCIEKE